VIGVPAPLMARPPSRCASCPGHRRTRDGGSFVSGRHSRSLSGAGARLGDPISTLLNPLATQSERAVNGAMIGYAVSSRAGRARGRVHNRTSIEACMTA
jgi:hypothetical protein